MTYLFDGAWILIKTLRYGGLAVAFLGVGIFGVHFVRLNARAARGETNEVPRESWRGRRAVLGLQVLMAGAGMQLASFALSALIPHRF